MSVPRLQRAVINVGVGQGIKDAQFLETVEITLKRISGQKPVKTKAKKAISAFKIRQGMIVGMMATLRGDRMYDFVGKLINISLARIRDFRGLDPKSLDKQGNLTIGIKEHIVFPEISNDEMGRIHGLEVTIVTSAKNKEEALALFKYLGFPFKK